MKLFLTCLCVALSLSACSSAAERARTQAVYDKYDTHCRAHARDAGAEADQEARYRQCMDYFVTTDENCPYCTIDPHMQK